LGAPAPPPPPMTCPTRQVTVASTIAFADASISAVTAAAAPVASHGRGPPASIDRASRLATPSRVSSAAIATKMTTPATQPGVGGGLDVQPNRAPLAPQAAAAPALRGQPSRPATT